MLLPLYVYNTISENHAFVNVNVLEIICENISVESYSIASYEKSSIHSVVWIHSRIMYNFLLFQSYCFKLFINFLTVMIQHGKI